MRPLKIIEHISLDGVVQVTACEGDGFPYADWTVPYRTPAGAAAVMAAHGEHFDLVLGRRTYDAWAGYWPTAPASPIADRINGATKHVVTHRPDSLAWGPVQAVGEETLAAIGQLKSTPGPGLVLSGSATLTSAVLAQGLADELVLIVYPTLLGTGKRLFEQGTPGCAFELVATQATPTGVLLNTYQAVGRMKTVDGTR